MKKPFILVDIENREMIVIIKSVAKVIPFDKIGKEIDFLDEIYRRYKTINMINKYSEVDRKAFSQLVDDLRVQHQSPLDLLNKNASEDIPETGPQPSRAVQEGARQDQEDLNNSTLVRSVIEKRISIDDLGMKFNTPYDYYDLSVFDRDKVKRSTQLSFFMRKGAVVKTTFEEIESIKNKCLKEKRAVDEARRSKQIVERKDILGDEDEGLVMSDEEMRAAMRNDPGASRAESREASSDVDLDGPIGDVVGDFFGERNENILSGGMDSDMQSIMRTMKK